MDLNDIINQMNQQYEEVDSKQEIKEEKVDMEKILEPNKVTEKWLEDEREYQENCKNDNHSKDAFTRKVPKSYYRKEDEKEKSSKSSSSYYRDEKRSSYDPYGRTSTSSKKTPDELFYERVEKSFNDKVCKMVENVLDKHLNLIDKGREWDILDLQYELNKKRIADRDYEDTDISKDFMKKMEKHSDRCSRKIDIAEVLVVLKVNPYN